MELTQHEKILKIMETNPQKEWWYAPDFQQPDLGELFVGYEATARMSELAKMYPERIETKRIGKYRYIKLKKGYVAKDKPKWEIPHDQHPRTKQAEKEPSLF